MSERSALASVRNPLLGLPSAARFQALPPEAKEALAELLGDMRDDARIRAQESWRKNKGPMAAYWKAVGAYTNHIRRLIRT